VIQGDIRRGHNKCRNQVRDLHHHCHVQRDPTHFALNFHSLNLHRDRTGTRIFFHPTRDGETCNSGGTFPPPMRRLLYADGPTARAVLTGTNIHLVGTINKRFRVLFRSLLSGPGTYGKVVVARHGLRQASGHRGPRLGHRVPARPLPAPPNSTPNTVRSHMRVWHGCFQCPSRADTNSTIPLRTSPTLRDRTKRR